MDIRNKLFEWACDALFNPHTVTWGVRGIYRYVLPYIFMVIELAAPPFHVFLRNIVVVIVQKYFGKKNENYKLNIEITPWVQADLKKSKWTFNDNQMSLSQ